MANENLSREQTLSKLVICEKTARELKRLTNKRNEIITEIHQKEIEVEKLKVAPRNLRIDICTLLIIPYIITIPFAIIYHKSQYKKYNMKYTENHKEEIDAKVNKFYDENIVPLEQQLEEVDKSLDELHKSGKIDDAKNFVGEDMFYLGCIQDLYAIVKSRRADTIKEALNHYDDMQYKARMEEMQAAIQNAAEISAIESARQTEYAKSIEKNTHQAATAAKATAHHTRQIDRNTRRFR